jgi:predicted 3-demethylubiquinone-9 3-methyltransferase (glyoxalase superfamily)
MRRPLSGADRGLPSGAGLEHSYDRTERTCNAADHALGGQQSVYSRRTCRGAHPSFVLVASIASSECERNDRHDESLAVPLVRKGHGGRAPFLHVADPRFVHSLDVGRPGRQSQRPAGSVRLAAFTIGDQRCMAVQGGPFDPFNHSFSITVECDDQAEIDRLWDALKEGGSVERCGWLRDRWGLCWQITPRRLGELMHKGGDQARRVAEAMLRMVKFDIAGSEVAAMGAKKAAAT